LPEQFAEVVFPIPLKQVFSYSIPEALVGAVALGSRVLVSFGRRHTVGVVTGLTGKAPTSKVPMKPLGSLLDDEPFLTPDLLELGRWMADYYHCSLGEALFAMLPTGYRRNPKAFLSLVPGADQGKVEALLTSFGKMRGVNWKALSEGKLALTPRTRKLAEALRKEGLGVVQKRGEEGPGATRPAKLERSRKPPAPKAGPLLHPQQQAALEAVTRRLSPQGFHCFLLQGVTGSGKTEVYLRAIAETLEKGRQALVLIPEIALTPQTVERFTDRFGDRVAVLHSRLSQEERTSEWRKIFEGKADVAVGARSALFAPMRKLGLVVVDEEHEGSYKQEDAPRYQARDAAVKRAQLCGAVALLGSATPSLESVKNAQEGKYTLLPMPDRVNKKPLPKVKLVDLREEWAARGEERPVLSLALEEALRETLERKEQAILFLNRRGFSTVTLCLKCGEQVHCPNCSIPVTSHRSSGKGRVHPHPISGARPGSPPEMALSPRGRGGKTGVGSPVTSPLRGEVGANAPGEGAVRGNNMGLLCHYCDWRGPVPEKCPSCKDGEVKQLGLGTERLEEEIKTRFPKARVARMDLDTTRKAGSLEAILGKFRRKEIDLLVGTQMIAKGHDFPGVTLVGVVGADVGLALPDFRAGERVFQLMVQVAGRAGRAEKEGTIYLQTFHPEHSALRAAVQHDTASFFASELELRKALDYPPYSRLGLLVYRHKEERKASAAAEKAAEFLRKEAERMAASATREVDKLKGRASGERSRTISVLGPAPCPIFKLRGQYRFQVLLKCPKPGPLRELVRAFDAKVETPAGVMRVVDLDPQNML